MNLQDYELSSSNLKGNRSLTQPSWVVVHLAMAFIAFLSVALLYFSTHWGPGIGGDATIYITSARNLIAGKGLGLIEPTGEFRLLPYFAPFFSLILSFFGLFGVNLVEAARWWNILMFAGLVLLAGEGTYRLTRSAGFGLLAAGILAGSPILIPLYSWAMSEPTALFLGFAGLYLSVRALDEDRLGAAFYGSAVLTGLSFLTRYSSAGFVGAVGLGLLLFRSRRGWARVLEAAWYGVIAAVPTAVWLWIDYRLTDTVSSRSMETGKHMAQRLADFWPQVRAVLLTWPVPTSWIDAPRYPEIINRALPLLMLLAMAAWGIALGATALRQRVKIWEDGQVRWAVLLGLLLFTYTAVILAVYATTYPPITIDNRMLSPLHIGVFWLVIILASLTVRLAPSWRWMHMIFSLALLVLALWFGWRSLRIVQVNYEKGLGYSSLDWRNSPTVRAAQALPAGTVVVTNEQTALLFLANIRAFPVMEVYQDGPSPVLTRFGDGDLSKDEGQRLFRENQAPLVLFNSIDGQMESLYRDQAAERVKIFTQGLRQVFKGDDGAIYTYAAP
jgi:hypothetical protein